MLEKVFFSGVVRENILYNSLFGIYMELQFVDKRVVGEVICLFFVVFISWKVKVDMNIVQCVNNFFFMNIYIGRIQFIKGFM